MRRLFLSSMCLLLALGSADCDKLNDISQGTCGNGVVDAGEDCDGFTNAQGFACRASDADWGCSFECKEDGSCPTGYGCGADGVCRKPKGTFQTAAFAVAPSQADELYPGDFDGDRSVDIVSLEAGRFRVSSIDDSGAVQQVSIASDARPSIGKVGALALSAKPQGDLDKTDDIVLPLHLGIGTLLSGGDRTFTAKTYPSVTLGDEKVMGIGTVSITGVLPVALDALPDSVHIGDETAALTSSQLGKNEDPSGYFVNFGAGGSQPVFTVPNTHPSDLSGPPVIQNMDESDKCKEIVFPKTEATSFLVMKPCKETKMKDANNQPIYDWLHWPEDQKDAVVGSVDVGGTIQGPVFPYDVNSDGHVDLLIPALVGGVTELRVAFGVGNGTFHSEDPIGKVLPNGQGDGHTGKLATLDAVPLALGKLDGDAFPDIVDATHVRLGSPNGDGTLSFSTIVYQSQHPWTEALITKINADQFADVVASSENSPDIDILTGNPSPLLNPFTMSTDGDVSHLTVGDFDGDLVGDIAFQEILSTTDNLLMISYGQAVGGPSSPQQVGTFPYAIDHVVAGNVLTFGADDITDLGVASTQKFSTDPNETRKSYTVSFFPGSSDRFLQAPYLLQESNQDGRLEVPIETTMGQIRTWNESGADDAHNGLALLAYAPPQDMAPGQAKLDQEIDALRLWGLFFTGEGDFNPVSSVCHLPKGAIFFPGLREALSITVSKSPVGTAGKTYVSAPLVYGYANQDSATVRAMLGEASFDDKGGCTFEGGDKPLHTGEGELLFRVRALELNGNDTPEILAVRKTFKDPKQLLQIAKQSGMPGMGSGGSSLQTDQSDLVIFWDGNLGADGALVPYLPPKPPATVADYTAGDVDGDGKPELLVVGRDGAAAYKLGADGKSLDLITPPLPDLAGSRAVLYADADGDGVLDLIVAQSGLQFFKGDPSRTPAPAQTTTK